MSFIAVFDDGPCVDQVREWAVGDPYPDLFFTPFGSGTTGKPRWTMVGFTGQEPIEPWPDQVHYVLDRTEEEKPPYKRRTAHYKVEE